MVREIIIFLVFLYAALFIAYSGRDPLSFYYTQELRDIFLHDVEGGSYDFRKVTNEIILRGRLSMTEVPF